MMTARAIYKSMTTHQRLFCRNSTQRGKGAEKQSMKSINVFVVALVLAFNASAADVLTEKLQRGLFEEEANHNLDAAIKEYQSVVAQSDEQRKVTATALFRLGECYRKLGRTNEANAQYLRILRDFSEQEQLVGRSRELLPRSSAPLASFDTVTNPVAVNLLREEIRVVEQSVQAKERQLAAGRVNSAEVLDAKKEVLRLKRRLPENAALSRQRALLQEQIDIAKQHLADIQKLASDRRAPGLEVPVQRELLSLQRELADVSDVAAASANETVAGRSAESELVRELERRQARLQGELSEASSRFKVMSNLSVEQFFRSTLSTDSVLADLQQRLQKSEQTRAEFLKAKNSVGAAREEEIQNGVWQQIKDRMESILASRRTEVEVLAAQVSEIEAELEKARNKVASVPNAPAGSPTLTQAEAEALARAKTLARNSPDLLQSPTRDGLGELQLGARDGFYSVVEFILAQGVGANGPERGTPPLVLAAKGGHLRIVQMLLDKGADVNAVGGGNTALMAACENGYRAVVELLLERGADVNRVGSGTALHKVAAKGYTGLAELLLQREARPDVVDNNKETPLHRAVSGGFTDVAESLLKAGASTTITNFWGVTPLHSAASRGDTNIASRLLDKGANPNVEDSEGKTPLYNAVNSQRPVEMVRLLLARGADVNHRDVIRRQGVATMTYYPVHYPILNGQQEVLEAMLEAKPDLQVTVPNVGTPLLAAVDKARTAMVERILRAGANPNFSSWENPPLFYAVGRGPQIVAALLKHGADPNFVNQAGYTPLFGVTQPEILQLLLDHKADPNKGSNPLTELLRRRQSSLRVPPSPGVLEPPDYPAIELLLKGGANPNAAYTDGRRLLTYAVNTRDVKLVNLLLKHGAEVNYVANNETPLSLAQSATRDPRYVAGYPEQVRDWEQIEKALREHGANEYLQRLSTISYTRPAWTGGAGKTVFSRYTNDYNRHTLFEMLAVVFTGNDQPVFPDLSRVTIERLEGTNPKPKELAINIDELLRAADCSKDTWVEWGDRISFPETDHPLNEGWPGFSQETIDLLKKCLTRRVSIIVKQETNVVKLMHNWSPQPGSGGVPGFPGAPISQPLRTIPVRASRQLDREMPAKEKAEKVLHTFRLKEVVYGANVLRASSDPTRVRVTRRDGDKTKEWVFNLNRVATASESSSGRLPTSEDLWLRDGDVIEIPEKP